MYQDDTATISAKIETHVSRLGPQFPSVQSLIAPAVCKIVRYRTRLGAACTTVSDPLVRQFFNYYLPHSFTVLAQFCARPKRWMQIPDQMCLRRAIGLLIPRKMCPYRRIAFGSTDASTLLITVRTPSYLGVACS